MSQGRAEIILAILDDLDLKPEQRRQVEAIFTEYHGQNRYVNRERNAARSKLNAAKENNNQKQIDKHQARIDDLNTQWPSPGQYVTKVKQVLDSGQKTEFQERIDHIHEIEGLDRPQRWRAMLESLDLNENQKQKIQKELDAADEAWATFREKHGKDFEFHRRIAHLGLAMGDNGKFNYHRNKSNQVLNKLPGRYRPVGLLNRLRGNLDETQKAQLNMLIAEQRRIDRGQPPSMQPMMDITEAPADDASDQGPISPDEAMTELKL